MGSTDRDGSVGAHDFSYREAKAEIPRQSLRRVYGSFDARKRRPSDVVKGRAFAASPQNKCLQAKN
jgi:hypothetical protein